MLLLLQLAKARMRLKAMPPETVEDIRTKHECEDSGNESAYDKMIINNFPTCISTVPNIPNIPTTLTTQCCHFLLNL